MYRTNNIRAAIEPHARDQKRNRYKGLVNLLIDIVSDALESLMIHSPKGIPLLCTTLAQSGNPLLQRLAIHGINVTQELDADGKIQWLQQHGVPHDRNSHHEQYTLVRQAYIDASPEVRAQFLQVLCSKAKDSDSWPDESYAAWRLSIWLYGLQEVAPDCSALHSHLERLQQMHPELAPALEPEFYNGLPMPEARNIGPPVTAEELLAKPASNWLPRLLAFGLEPHFRGIRLALGQSVTEAAQKRPAWGWELADALIPGAQGVSYLWQSLLIAWKQIDLDHDDYGKAFKYIEQSRFDQVLTDETWYLEITLLLDRLALKPFAIWNFFLCYRRHISWQSSYGTVWTVQNQ